MMKVLEAINITKEFPGVKALDNVSVSFEKGKIHGIVGENGAGKSTLIKVLTGLYTPESGKVLISGEDAGEKRELFDAISYVPQELNQFSNMTVADNLFMPYEKTGINSLVINKKQIFALAQQWLDKVHISAMPDQLVKDVPISEQQLLQIARALVNEKASVILLDEPTTSLTDQDTARLFQVIREIRDMGKSIVFISHKLKEVFDLCDDIIVMRNGEKVADALTKDVDIPWAIRNMVGREIDASKRYPSESVSDDVLLEVKGLCGEMFDDISFCVHKGEIVGFSGLVGAGRSEIMQAILGYVPVFSGSVKLCGTDWKFGDPHFSTRTGFIYLPEERKTQGIFRSLSVQHNATISLLEQLIKSLYIPRKQEITYATDIVRSYEVKTTSLSQHIEFLSGGNQQKVIIGRAMYTNPKVLVFDEPTKGIDVGTKAAIYKLMKKLAETQQVGIILVSSEMEEILKCSNRIICMYHGRINGEFDAEGIDQHVILNSIMGIS